VADVSAPDLDCCPFEEPLLSWIAYEGFVWRISQVGVIAGARQSPPQDQLWIPRSTKTGLCERRARYQRRKDLPQRSSSLYITPHISTFCDTRERERVIHVPELDGYHRRRAALMCRLVIRTPLPYCIPDMAAAELDLGIITHREGVWLRAKEDLARRVKP
jgi:hypothetical protein